MQIVIDIPERVYNYVIDRWQNITVSYSSPVEIMIAIKNGVVLPEKHGRLIDHNEVMKQMIPLSFSNQKWISEVDLSNVPTVIKSSKVTS